MRAGSPRSGLLRGNQGGAGVIGAAGSVLCDALLDLRTEVHEEALDRPGGGIAQAADGVTLDLAGDVEQQVDLLRLGLAGDHPLHDPPHPAGALAAGGALAAALVLVEVGEPGDRGDDVAVLVHDDHGGGAEAGLAGGQVVEVHQGDLALFGGDHPHRRAAGNDRLEVSPAAAYAPEMVVDELADRDRHRLLDHAGPVDVAGRAHQLGAGVLRAAEVGEPFGPAAQDLRGDGDRFDVVDGGRAAVDAGPGRERRLEARLALLALQALQQGHLVAADVGPGAVGDADVAVPAVDVVLADQPRLGGLDQGRLQAHALQNVFTADVDDAVVGADGVGGQQAAFDEPVRIEAHDLPVLAGAGLGLVGVDHQEVRPLADLLGHEGPLQAGGEAGPAPATQPRRLDLVADPIGRLGEHVGGGVPHPARPCPLEAPVVQTIEVGEDAVLVFENADHAHPLEIVGPLSRSG